METCIAESPWAHYIAEREAAEVYETAEGFAIYKIEQKTVFIQDIYIKPEHRRKGAAAKIADSIATIAIERGCTTMLGSVCPSAKNAHQSLQVLLAYGMQLLSAQHNIIYFSMSLE